MRHRGALVALHCPMCGAAYVWTECERPSARDEGEEECE
nr:MAG TPA: tax1-binding protein [Caudoviricetes sp.]